MENQLLISIFIYTISETDFPCIVLLLTPSPKPEFHIHDFLKCLFVYIPPCMMIPEAKSTFSFLFDSVVQYIQILWDF